MLPQNNEGEWFTINKLASYYGKTNILENLINKAIQKEVGGGVGVFYWNNKKIASLNLKARVQFPRLGKGGEYISNIARDGSPVKVIAKVKDIPQFRRWFKKSPFVNTDGTPEVYYYGTPYGGYIREMSSYEGKPIRLIACQSGAKDDGAAQQLANELGGVVIAPTETVHVNDLGEMFLCDNKVLAEMWLAGENVKETGKWIEFKPKGVNK